MIHSRSWSAVAIVSVLVGVIGAPSSLGAAEAPLALSGVLPGSGYVAVKVDWSGEGDLTLELQSSPSPGSKSHGVTVVRPDGSTWTLVLQGSGILGNADCVIVRTDATGSVQDACEPSAMQRVVFPPGRGTRVAITVSEAEGDAAGVWTLVAWQAFRPGAESAGSWTLAGDGAVLGVTMSDRAFVLTAPDFEGGTAASGSFAGAFVSVHAGSTAAFEVHDTLFGLFKADDASGRTPGMTLHGPLGTQTCLCRFLSPLPSPDAAPGEYVVELNRVGAGLQSTTEATVFVLDLRLPE